MDCRRIVEDCLVVYLDDNDENEFILTSLRQVINSIKTFTNPDECIDFITDITNVNIFLIIPHSIEEILVSVLHDFRHVCAIHIITDDQASWIKQYSKVDVTATTDITSLCLRLSANIKQIEHDLISISVLSEQSKDEIDPQFMHIQLLKESLLDMQFGDEDIRKFVTICRNHQDNPVIIRTINSFEEEYSQHSPIWWYTNHTFVYCMLNRALRTFDIEMLLSFGFYIVDLHREIEKMHSTSLICLNRHVYRGQNVLKEEFFKMKNNVGGFLSFNSFLSTSMDENVAQLFTSNILDASIYVSVLFDIFISPESGSLTFALIENISQFPEEKECLFSIPTVFRIIKIEEPVDGIWKINLGMTNADDLQLNRLTHYFREHIAGTTGIERLSMWLGIMNKHEKAMDFCKLIRDGIIDEREPTIIQADNLLRKNQHIGNVMEKSLEYAETALEFCIAHLPNDHELLAKAYVDVAHILLSRCVDLNRASQYFEYAFEIHMKNSSTDPERILMWYMDIAHVYKSQGDLNKALESYEKALQFCSNHLPLIHPERAFIHQFMGMIYDEKKDASAALHHFEESLEILQRSLPPSHVSLGVSHMLCAGMYSSSRNYEQAIKHATLSVKIFSVGTDQPRTQMAQTSLDGYLQIKKTIDEQRQMQKKE